MLFKWSTSSKWIFAWAFVATTISSDAMKEQTTSTKVYNIEMIMFVFEWLDMHLLQMSYFVLNVG